jgi:hypothetical protein
VSGGASDSSRLTYNLGNDRTGSPIFLTRDAARGRDWWKVRKVGTAPVEIELSIEQIRMIAQVTHA